MNSSFVFNASDLGSMNPAVALGLARHLAQSDRVYESMDALALVAFEDSTHQLDISDHERALSINRLVEEAFLIAAQGGGAGVSRLLDSLARRNESSPAPSGHPARWPDRYRANEDMSQRAHQIFAASTFRRLATQIPDAAVEMAQRAPAWMGLHQCPSDANHRQGKGFVEALVGAWPLKVSRAYFERDAMISALLNEKDYSFRPARKLVQNFGRAFDPQLDAKACAPLELLLSMVIDAPLKNKAVKQGVSDSPLPKNWMASFCLGGFVHGRSMLFEAYGRDSCLEISRRETEPNTEAPRILDHSQSWSMEHALDLFSPEDLLKPSDFRLAQSSVARLARAQEPKEFARSLELLIERGGRSALLASCTHRFWVIQEGGSNRARKQGDMLAYCAAEGLIGQAEVLLACFPHIDRKPVRETLAYMGKRSTEKYGSSLAAWESLLLREIGRTSPPVTPGLWDSEPPPAPRRKRL